MIMMKTFLAGEHQQLPLPHPPLHHRAHHHPYSELPRLLSILERLGLSPHCQGHYTWPGRLHLKVYTMAKVRDWKFTWFLVLRCSCIKIV